MTYLDWVIKRLVSLLVACIYLPDSKVRGVDIWGRKVPGRTGLKGLFDKEVSRLREELGDRFSSTMETIVEQYKDRARAILDRADGLYQNEEIDSNWGLPVGVDRTEEFRSAASYWRQIRNVAHEAQARHDRLVMRLAIVDQLRERKLPELIERVNDSLVQRLLDGEAEFDEGLKPFVVTRDRLLRKEREILRKDQAAYFRERLEDKARLLRELSFRAERSADGEFRAFVTRLALRTKAWCEARLTRPRPYSRRAVAALYNEAVHTLVALGVYRVAFTKKEYNSDEECSFFTRHTREGMVDVKGGLDWAAEVRVLYYEVEDGTGRTPVRGSGC